MKFGILLASSMCLVLPLGESALPQVRTGALTDKLSLDVLSVCGQPLPFQATRFRITLRNLGNARIERLAPVETAVSPHFRTSCEKHFRQCSVLRLREFPLPVGQEGRNGPGVWFLDLDPGASIAVSCAMAADWGESRNHMQNARPLFADSGVTIFRFQYIAESQPTSIIFGEKALNVPEPAGDDANIILPMIRSYPAVADAIMSPVDEPAAQAMSGLQLIAEQFPNSSYAPYARFALARAQLRGLVQSVELPREGLRETITQLLRNSGGDDANLRARLINHAFRNGRVGEQRSKAIDRVLAAKATGQAVELRAAIEDLTELSHVSNEECIAGIAHLNRIASVDFPYRPYVLIAMRAACYRVDGDRARAITEILDLEYPDAWEWKAYKPRPAHRTPANLRLR